MERSAIAEPAASVGQGRPAGRPRAKPWYMKEGGQSFLELALILPILIIIMLGALDLGRMFFFYTAVANATRAGGTYAINARGLDEEEDRVALIREAVRNEITGQNVDVEVLAVRVLNSAGADLTNEGIVKGETATVEVTYAFELLLPWNGPWFEWYEREDPRLRWTYSSTIRFF